MQHNTPLSPKIMCVAGEASGDMHGGHLVEELTHQFPNARIYGMGMGRMRAAGMETLIDATGLSIMGVVEIATHFIKLRRVYLRLKAILSLNPPDLLIIIDYPEMGLRLAREARKLGVKVLYYIAPKIWASRPGRISRIKRCVDMMAVIFPFEEHLYRAAGVPVHYVGHPLVADIKNEAEEPAGHPPQRHTILLLPGSRPHEIKYMLPILCRTAKIIQRALPHPPRYVLLKAPGADQDIIQAQIKTHGLQCEIRTEMPYHAMRRANLALAVSGTVTLQLALCETPMLVAYKTHWLTYMLCRWLIKTPYISLVNILGQRAIVSEFIQSSAKPESMSASALSLLNDPEKMKKMRMELASLSETLGTENSAMNTAQLARDMLSMSSPQ